jgi:DNA repair protein RecO (recombination protein O)
VTQAESVDHFRDLRNDLDRLTRAVTMLEVVDQLSLEGEPNPRLYRMLLGALRALAAQDSPLVVGAFVWKVLSLEGFQPLVDACAVCGRSEDLVAFDLTEGGVLCQADRRGVALSAGALDLLRRILGGRLGAALNEPDSAATTELDHLAVRALEHHLERRLRSVGLLDRG